MDDRIYFWDFSCFSALVVVVFFASPGTFAQENAPSVATTKPDVDLLETEVLGLRVWMIIGIVGVALMIVVVVLCCIFDCRIPRTKAEIEADHENAQLIKQYKDTIEQAPKGKKVKIIKAIPSSALSGLGLDEAAKTEEGETRAQASTSTELTEHNDTTASAAPLAQHPSTLLTGGNEPHLRKPLGATNMRPGLVATVRTLASLRQLQKKKTSDTEHLDEAANA